MDAMLTRLIANLMAVGACVLHTYTENGIENGKDNESLINGNLLLAAVYVRGWGAMK